MRVEVTIELNEINTEDMIEELEERGVELFGESDADPVLWLIKRELDLFGKDAMFELLQRTFEERGV